MVSNWEMIGRSTKTVKWQQLRKLNTYESRFLSLRAKQKQVAKHLAHQDKNLQLKFAHKDGYQNVSDKWQDSSLLNQTTEKPY